MTTLIRILKYRTILLPNRKILTYMNNILKFLKYNMINLLKILNHMSKLLKILKSEIYDQFIENDIAREYTLNKNISKKDKSRR